ncbi:YdcF family protein [Candidatus Saccharibacteria bacterium]|nr:YdcF family protein [Candidatus Saccharibacteria bacterium]
MFPSPDELQFAQVIWDYMFLKQKPHPADVIIGLGSHDVTVADDAAELYKNGLAPVIVFTGNVGRMTAGVFNDSEARSMSNRAQELGVPERQIILEEQSTNTGENIQLTQQLLERLGVAANRVILVHKPYMLRRDYATFICQWHGAQKVQLQCWAREVSLHEYLAKDPLTAHETISVMIGDLQRIQEYPKLGYQINQKIPDNVRKAFKELVSRGYDTHLINP